MVFGEQVLITYYVKKYFKSQLKIKRSKLDGWICWKLAGMRADKSSTHTELEITSDRVFHYQQLAREFHETIIRKFEKNLFIFKR